MQEEVVLGHVRLVLRHLMGPKLQLVPDEMLHAPLHRGAPLERGRHRGGEEELGIPQASPAPFAVVNPQQRRGGLGVGLGLLG